MEAQKKKIARYIGYTTLGVFVAICLFFSYLQTDHARHKIRALLINQAKQINANLSIEKIEGSLPFSWNISNIEIERPNEKIAIESIRVTFSPLSLFKGVFSLSSVYVGETVISFDLVKKSREDTLIQLSNEYRTLSPPFPIRVKDFEVPHITFINRKSEQKATYTLTGHGKLQRKKRLSSLGFSITEIHHPNNVLSFALSKVERGKKMQLLAHCRLENKEALAPFYTLEKSPRFEFSTQLKGPFETWKSVLLRKEGCETKPIEGFIEADIEKIAFPQFYAVDYPLSVDSTFSLNGNHSIDVSKLLIRGPLITFKMQGIFNPDLSPYSGSLSYQLPNLRLMSNRTFLDIEGGISGYGEISPEDGFLTLKSDTLKIGKDRAYPLEGRLKLTRNQNQWEGDLGVKNHKSSFPIKLSASLLGDERALRIPNFKMQLANSHLDGKFAYFKVLKYYLGDFFLNAGNLLELDPLLPTRELGGRISAALTLTHDERQKLEFDIASHYIHYNNFLVHSLFSSGEVEKVYDHFEGTLTSKISDAKWKNLQFNQFDINLHTTNDKIDFETRVRGFHKDPFSFSSKGAYLFEPEINELYLNELTGNYWNQDFVLDHPTLIRKTSDLLLIDKLKLTSTEGHFEVDARIEEKDAKGEIHAKNFPIDLFLLPFPDLTIRGTTSMDGFMSINETEKQGSIAIALEEASVEKHGMHSPTKVRGNILANFEKDRLQIFSGIKATRDQFFELNGSIPLELSHFPFKAHIPKDSYISAKLAMDGNIEEIFDFVDLGTHSVRGLLSTELAVSGTRAKPQMNGKIDLQKGKYENYYTGTRLREITAKAHAEKQLIHIEELTALDPYSGTLFATGEFDASYDRRSPFKLESELNDLRAIGIDYFKSNVTGPIKIQGNRKGAMAQGNLNIPWAQIEIPEKLPITIPEMDITFINPPHDLEADLVAPVTTYPLNLNLDLSSSGKIFLSGRGLSSEWSGDLSLSGTNSDLIANGKCTLVKGEYQLGSKTFQLTEGTITFSDKIKDGAHINVQGALDLDDSEVKVTYFGPLLSPELKFSSTPNMPTSSILARILFNKDIAEISPFQAFQLAQVVMSLSGKMGPDVLNVIRKNLGIDKLTIVQNGESSDDVAVQIGKYLVDGVMVTLSQSKEKSQVMVEVELKKGFSFVAETQEEEEGKFTLKWNYNY